MMKQIKGIALSGIMALGLATCGPAYKNQGAGVEERVESVLKEMTLEEKIDYIGGTDHFYIRDIPRLGLPKIKLTDGPVGARNDGRTTAYPAGILSASTWDTALLYKLGYGLAQDSKARGSHILLGPGVNIYRVPMCGRNFEYFGEDPFLVGKLGVHYIKGMQENGVAACVKHYAANNQEWDRYNISSEVDERTLREIYLPAFKMAVQEANVATVMNSYNLINGEHATQNGFLNNQILKEEWGFDGILMSDWGSTHDGLAAALGGLDLEMPKGDHMNRENLLKAIENGQLSEAVIDDKVRRILRIIFRFGFYDKEQKDTTIPLDNPETGKIALQLAREGMVLLKNEGGMLPFDKSKARDIVIIGMNATYYTAGGGSSWTFPFEHSTVIQGVKAIVGETANIVYLPGFPTVADYARLSAFYTAPGSSTKGLKGEYFKNKNLEGNPDFTRTDSIINFNWFNGNPNVEGFANNNYSIRWTGIIRPRQSKKYEFHVSGDDGYRLWIDNQLVIDLWKDQGVTPASTEVVLQAGKDYDIKLEYYQKGGGATIALGYKQPVPALHEAVNAARNADMAILCMGFNGDIEKEGIDRPFELPEGQDALISAVCKAQKNTAVVMFGGGNVDMNKWLPDAKSLLYAWYPGQDGGQAIAEILFGAVNPSGKLPATFEQKLDDNPAYAHYYDPDGDKKNPYLEGIYVGYRGYEKHNIKPLFPFGFGLSYTTFEYSGLKIEDQGNNNFLVSFSLTNTGKVEGKEIAQLYLAPVHPSVDRPVKELKGFAKVALAPGETKKVGIPLEASSFQYFHPERKEWATDEGTFQVILGPSSAEVGLQGTIKMIGKQE
jgi:beta-glucosidase